MNEGSERECGIHIRDARDEAPTPGVYCPKCGQQRVKIVCVSPPPEPEMISMDDLPGDIGTGRPAVLILERMRATCLNCGYEREYTE